MSKLWIVVKNRDSKRVWWKYFIKESDMNKFINKIKHINNLLIIEDSRDIVWR